MTNPFRRRAGNGAAESVARVAGPVAGLRDIVLVAVALALGGGAVASRMGCAATRADVMGAVEAHAAADVPVRAQVVQHDKAIAVQETKLGDIDKRLTSIETKIGTLPVDIAKALQPAIEAAGRRRRP